MARSVQDVYTHLLMDLQRVLELRQVRDDWMILLCPSSGIALVVLKILASLIPSNQDIKFSGRTILFPQGKISVASASDSVFAEEGFSLIFLEWVSGADPKDTDRWKAQAKEIIRLKAAS